MCLCLIGSGPPARAANFGVTINPMVLVHSDATKMHKLVYVAEALAAMASLGADGYSSEVAVVQTPAWLRKHGYGCSPCIVESNALFLHNVAGEQQFSQAKFWTYKSVVAASGFAGTWAIHRMHKDDVHSDIASIVSSGASAAFFTSIAFHNLHLASSIKAQNVMARASPQ
jgi:hypothetical protein